MDLFLAVSGSDITTLFVLFLLAILAGWVDSIGGGGGLISIPALLWAGHSPLEVLATNKLQSSFGSLTATINYARQGLLSPREHIADITLTFLGALLGALVVQRVDSSILQRLIPVLLIGFAIYLLLSPNLGALASKPKITRPLFAATAGFGIGFYDGFFGPGTGTFFAIAFISLLGYTLPRATASTKLLNFTSNAAALFIFILSGHVLWLTGLIMGTGQIIGSWVGSHMAAKHGVRLIRPLLIVVSLLVSLRLLLAA
ncbi:TSUP family transporter [Thiolinea disciformis]|uniref:TSUP family transporter n=1 Tax=Thiolinea disciformis TaxID=125614 RepID=UPI0003616C5A|nr:TSUP family transporter [Thiolinea disciformis]